MVENKLKVVYYPAFSNPYQKLLYDTLKRQNNIISVPLNTRFDDEHFLVWFFTLPFKLILLRLRGFHIFHLHWQHFQVPIRNIFLSTYLSTIYAIYFILLVKILGFRLVWTIHNITPHEKRFIDDLLITKFIVGMSVNCIVHSDGTKLQLSQLGIDTENIKVIQLGSYDGVYENVITQNDARHKLNIEMDSFVFLFFGQIRAYKGVDILLKNFSSLLPEDNKIKLIIAGKCYDSSIRKEIEKYKRILQNSLVTHLSYISDDEVQLYMNVADISVIPFKKITTSASILLAMSFGLPVIYPSDFFRELPDNVGFKYQYIDELYNVMKSALKAKDLKQKGINARNYAAQFTWTDMAEKTNELYRSIC